jgi:hypothetical protein
VKIKDKFSDLYLRRSIADSPREKKVRNFNTARSIGVLFETGNEADYQQVHKYVNDLQARQKSVQALGYIRDPLLANHLMPMLSFDYVYDKNLNWYGKPKSEKYRDFCAHKFDILIDLSREDHVPLLFAAAESMAGFKIGRFSDKARPIFDMMIEVNSDVKLDDIIKHFDHYINLIKPVENEL